MTELNQAQLDQLYLEWSALGAKQEQERIIKFLEETIIKGGNHGWSISTIIGILKEEIKGEK